MIPADKFADLDRYEEEQYRRMRAAREEGEADDAAWNAVWDAERARPIAQRRYFSFAELADRLAVDPHTLAVDAALRGRIIADLTDWVKSQQFDLVGGEVAALSGHPPDFVPFVPLQPGAILVGPEMLMLRRDACQRYVKAKPELPSASGLLNQWFEPHGDAGRENVKPAGEPRSQEDKPLSTAPRPRKRRGPVAGTVRRYEATDRELFPEIDRMMRDQHISSSEAALRLATGKVEDEKVEGTGSAESHAKRLGSLYRAARRNPTETP
jgi:hypothetical protein